jgi:hypothetical protein
LTAAVFNHQGCEDLAIALRRILGQGLRLDMKVVRFIDATFDNPDAPTVAALLTDPDACEAESLLELVFYPDTAIQEKIEDLLGSTVFSQSDPARIVERLGDPPISVPLSFPDARGTMVLVPAETTLAAMVHRLNIHRSVSPPLAAACNRLGETYGRRARVMIRNTATPPGRHAVEFLCTFLDRSQTAPENTLQCLALALELLGELPADNIHRGLIQTKHALRQALERTGRMDRAATGQNMETRMMQGLVTPHIDRAKTRRKMDLIDTLCRVAFGRAALFSSPGENDLGTVASDRDMADLVRRLS